jgi:hypothetical protein
VLVDLKQASFDGDVVVDWLGANGAKLASSTYRTRDTQFRLALPAVGDARVAQVRVYASSPTGGRDAIGGIDFSKTPAPRSLRESIAAWWSDLTRAPAKPSVRTEDTIAILDFEPSATAPVATRVASAH